LGLLQILVLTAGLLFASQSLALPAGASSTTIPIIQVHHVQGDPYFGFRTSCVILFSDGTYHREHRIQVSRSEHAHPEWETPLVSEGSLNAGEFEKLLADVDEPSFSSISGIVGRLPDLRWKVAFNRGGEVVPHDTIDFYTVSVGRLRSAQVFQTSPEALRREPLLTFFDWFDQTEKRKAPALSPSQANGCTSMAKQEYGAKAQPPLPAGFGLPAARGAKPELPATASPGRVKLEFVVYPDGTTGGFKVVSSTSADGGQAVMNAAKQWMFFPARLLGVPVGMAMQAEVVFAGSPTVILYPDGTLHSWLDK